MPAFRKAPLFETNGASESIEGNSKDAAPTSLKALADQGDAEELLDLLDRVEGLAAQAGGVDRLRAYLEALKEIAA
jgi:hypothetical protein